MKETEGPRTAAFFTPEFTSPMSPPPSMSSKTNRDIISWHAYVSGLKAGGATSIVSAGAVLTANKYWSTFRSRLNVSGKTALALMPGLAVFTFVSEQRIVAGARNPEKYLATMDPNFVELQMHHRGSLTPLQRAANYWYDHPYRVLVMAGVPIVGGIFAYQSTNTAIQRSQQIMHTRLYAQSAVVALLLSTMAFNDFMKRCGRFDEEEDSSNK